jgi:4-methyl-5(b-hydroxyethyl)-thiazole monophosphate biosynthesis
MVVLFLANGFEEIEALMPLDLLRRADVEVTTVAINGSGADERCITGAHGISVLADISAADFVLPNDVEMVILPGGMPGATNLDASPLVDSVLRTAYARGAHLAAICAAPLVLGRRGYLEGRRATCYPGFEKELTGAAVVSGGCVIDTSEKGTVVTAAGMGVAYDFGMKLVELLRGKACADHIHSAVMAPGARA